jgi:hypothetical protein
LRLLTRRRGLAWASLVARVASGWRPFVVLLVAANGVAALDACGSRTGLGGDALESGDDGGYGDDADARDAGRNAREAGHDAVSMDALPPIDGAPRVDVRRDDCPDADATLVYLVSSTNELMSFHPPSLQFRTIGRIACPAGAGATPFSMAVDRKGKAYVVFTDGNLFRVSTATAACIATPFTPGQRSFFEFGMGFVSNNGGADETLYVAQNPDRGALSSGLAAIDVADFRLSYIGSFSSPIERVELTGTGDGRLFGYAPSDTGSRIVQIDKSNGDVVAADPVAAGSSSDGFAFAYWGGDFWIFTGVGSTTVYRYRPGDKSTTAMTGAPAFVVGAGVSTCAPQ